MISKTGKWYSARLWEKEWLIINEPSFEEKFINQCAHFYHENCERFDQHTCERKNESHIAIPITSDEIRLCSQHAFGELKDFTRKVSESLNLDLKTARQKLLKEIRRIACLNSK